jgi:hypothetical protein
MKNSLALLSFLLLSFSVTDSALAARGSTTCKRDRNAKPPLIKSLTADSSRRIHIVSEPAIYQGEISNVRSILVTDESGASIKLSGSNYLVPFNDAYVEGLIPGKTYQVVAIPGNSCLDNSAPLQITMPRDVEEAVLPVIREISRVNYNSFVGTIPHILLRLRDNTAVKSYRIYFDDVLMEDVIISGLRAWTMESACSPTTAGGGGFVFRVPSNWQGRSVSVRAEGQDIFGNKISKSVILQL